MKRLAPLALVVLAGCHRLTGLDGRPGEARHGNGYHILSQIALWLALFAIVAGVALMVHAMIRRPGRDHLLWAVALLATGVVLFLGTSASSLGLWLCHGTC